MRHYRLFTFLFLMLFSCWSAADAQVPGIPGPRAEQIQPEESEVAKVDEPVKKRRARIGHMEGRHRIELWFGYAQRAGATVQTNSAGIVTSSVGAENIAGGGGYSYWFRPDWAVSLHGSTMDASVESRVGHSMANEVSSVVSVLIGVRKEFLGSAEEPRVRPYMTAAVGPFIGSSILDRAGASGVHSHVKTIATFGGQVGGGIDFQISRLIMLGGRVGYNFHGDFSSPIGGRDNYSGFEAGVSLSFLLGKGTPPRE